jgi:hypothetical protein
MTRDFHRDLTQVIYGFGFRLWSREGLFLSLLRFLSGATPEAEAVVPGLQDVTVVREAVEQCGGHLGVAKNAGPSAEAEIGGDDHTGPLIELTEQVEE